MINYIFMTITTKFHIGQRVFFLDKLETLKHKAIVGIRVQMLSNGKISAYYSFVKDSCVDYDFTGELPNILSKNDFFWIPEECISETKSITKSK